MTKSTRYRNAPGRISAFTAANAVRYTLDKVPPKPRPGLRFDAASGDRNSASATLNTFNPLFPSRAHFNLANPVGPQNVIDLNPTLDPQLAPKVQLTAVWNPTRHVTLLASYVHVFPGPFLKETTPGLATDSVTAWLTYKF